MGFRPLAGLLLGALIVPGPMADTRAADVTVRNTEQLRRAISAAKPGTRVLLAPAHYQGGMYFAGLSGAPGKRIVNV